MTGKRCFVVLCTGVATLAALPAVADPGNIWVNTDLDCGNSIWTTTDTHAGTYRCGSSAGACRNDEYKSVMILESVRPGTIIRVWDSPDGEGDDDWAEITVGAGGPRDTVPFGDVSGFCVPSFETNRSAANYTITYHRHNGLNGKVSRIQIIPGPARPYRKAVPVPPKTGPFSKRKIAP